jgi:hypothetical protein
LAVGSLPGFSDADEAEIDKATANEHRSYFVSVLLHFLMAADYIVFSGG